MTEERNLKSGGMIYIGISSQKKPSYGGSNTCIIIQDSDTKQKWYCFTKIKEYLSGKFTPFLNKMKTMKKTSDNFLWNAGKNKTLEKNCMKNFEEINFNIRQQVLHRKMAW